ncbi:hypothetical protein HK405_000298 [Cladochytrium tenue]|nr:hypothetical protein HK405_000298 [Cladochytrium tenue]
MSSSAGPSANKVQQVQAQVDEVMNIMHDNINKAMQRGEELESLNTKTEDLQNSSLQFKKGANEVRKQMWWKDFKMKMILGGVILAIIAIIISCV